MMQESLRRLKESAFGGPVYAIGSATMPTVSQLLERAGYKTGQGTVDLLEGSGLPPESVAALGTAANAASQIPALAAGGFGAPAVLSRPIRGTAEWLMQSALKP